jgi:dienelactone hydrolase
MIRTPLAVAVLAAALAPPAAVAVAKDVFAKDAVVQQPLAPDALAPDGARAEDAPPQLAADLNETVVRWPVTVRLPRGGSRSGDMVISHFRPPGPGPFPIIIMNHGRNGENRATPPRLRFLRIARFWVRRGFAVMVPTRLGYGETGIDPDPEASGPCAAKNFQPMLDAGIVQVEGVIAFARTQPWADLGRIVLAGQSVGGFITVAAAGRRLPGVIAAINFAGGAGGNPKERPGQPCGADRIEAAFAAAGRTAQVPALFFYAENDRFWGASWPKAWHAAFVAAGGRARLVAAPPSGEDGHHFINTGFRLWRREVDRLLGELGFAAPRSADAPAASGFAAIEDAQAVPFVKPEVKDKGYQGFLNADVPRAFAISGNGAWAFASGEEAMARALGRCREFARRECRLYAVDDAVVWTAAP